ncbi:hypothetical protein YC2023_015722 [Brassica napus]
MIYDIVTTHPAHSDPGSQLCRAPTLTPHRGRKRLYIHRYVIDQLVKTRLVEVLLKCEVLGSSNAKCTNNLPVDVEAFPPTVRAQLVTACPVGKLLKGEVLVSSNAKHINNLHGGVSEGSHVRG